ncbi:zincin, partial [Basidiobolus meristosporus CBS 931.73]
DVLTSSSPQAVQGFLIWRIITRNINFLPDYYRKLFSLIQGKISGAKGAEPRMEMCLALADEAMGPILGRYFVLQHFGGNSQQLANRLISDIKRTFKNRLSGIKWLNQEGRDRAREKIDHLVQKIGYSQKSPDTMSPDSLKKHYEHLEVDPYDHFGNALRYRVWTFENHFNRIGKPVDREEWKDSPITVNAFYNHRRNEIEFPAGILQKPLYDANRPDYLNYGAIGSIVGHELTHGYDNKGSMFDKFGMQRQWWDDDTINAFSEKTQCLVDQYSKLKVRINKKDHAINPKLTLGENIAVIEAYHAWKNSSSSPESFTGNNPQLPGMENTTVEQLFFISYARMWCSNIQDTASLHRLRIDTHSPDNHRVNGVLRNNREFAEAFKCPLGSPMNPPKKCTIW